MFRQDRPVLRRQSSAEKALARANQRLQRSSLTRDDDSSDNEDDINNYLSSLRKKTAQGPDVGSGAGGSGKRRVSLGDGASDISFTDSSEVAGRRSGKRPQSKFLKSKPKSAAAVETPKSVPVAKATPLGTSAFQRSAALAKATSLTGKYAFKRAGGAKAAAKAKEDSDRSSSESHAKPGRLSRSPSGSTPEMLYAKSSRAKLNYLTDEESASIGKDGSKFLKKAASLEEPEEVGNAGNLTPKTRKQLRFAGLSDDDDDDIREVVMGEKSPKTPSSHSSSIHSGRFRRSFAISDEDMSTAELGDGIISSSSAPDTPKKPALKSPDTPTSPKKRVTIAETSEEVHEVLDASDLSFLEENVVERLGKSSSSSSISEEEESFRAIPENVLDVDELKSDEDSSPRPRLEAIQTIDDLSSISVVSDEHLKSSASSSSSSTSSTVIRSEARGVSQYDSDFETSEIVSEKTRPTVATTTYSQDFESSTQSSSAARTDYSSDSEETTVTESYTKRVHRRRRKSSTARDLDKSVQTIDVGLSYHWHTREAGQAHVGAEFGMGSVDLNPIAHYVVPPETLEGVTAYNPCVVALNNLLRQQLEMTQNFMSTQRRLYNAMSRTILPEYSYTTLEDTKKFISKNRPKSMTMEEALREVEQEFV